MRTRTPPYGLALKHWNSRQGIGNYPPTELLAFAEEHAVENASTMRKQEQICGLSNSATAEIGTASGTFCERRVWHSTRVVHANGEASMTDRAVIQTGIISEESSKSAVSWGAILAGGVASAAFTLFLVELVAGLGLVMVSPWSNSGASAGTLSVAGGIALVLMAVMASALGGYIASRLRTRWVGIHTDEVYFRDTAHGLLAWAVGTLILATVLASAAGTMLSSFTQGASSNPALVPDRNAYYVDSLFRSDRPAPANAATQVAGAADQNNAEASRLLARALTPGTEFTANDRTRAAQLVATRTGLSQQEAEQRVDQVINQAKAAADQARKAAAKMAFWIAASLIAGAFAAALAAMEGGRERDD